MKLLGSTKKVFEKDKNGENVPKLESAEVVLAHCNLVKNDYQHVSKVLFTFVPNKKFGNIKYFSTCFYNDEYNKYRVFFSWSMVYRSIKKSTWDWR